MDFLIQKLKQKKLYFQESWEIDLRYIAVDLDWLTSSGREGYEHGYWNLFMRGRSQNPGK